MARSAFMCEVECSLITSSGQRIIDPMFIKYITVDYGYQTTYMPIIYIMVKLPTDIYTMLKEGQKENKLYIRINKYNAYSNTSMSHKDVEGQFTYIVSDANPNYTQDLTEQAGADQTYHSASIACMSMEIMNRFKSSFNGIYGEIDQATLVIKAMDGLDAVVKPLLYNPTYDNINVPALNSKMKLLQFLYNKCPFYDTNFLFFIDFERGYLTDLTGQPYEAQDGQLSSVYFDVKDYTTETSYYEGMETKNGAYYMHVNPADIDIVPNEAIDKMSNQYVFISDEGSVDYVDLDVNNNPDSDVKQSFQRGNNPILYKNIAESNTIVVEIVKENIDSSIITPNKEYIIANAEDYANYNGNYTLLQKQEYFINNSGDFGMSTTIRLRKVGNITSIGQNIALAASAKASSVTRKYGSTKGTSTSVPVKSNSTTTKSTSSSNNGVRASAISMTLPKVKRIRATSDNSLKRSPRKISGEG